MENGVLVTSTFAKSVLDVRAQVALRTAENARRRGLQLISVDDGSDPKFVGALREREVLVVTPEEPGIIGCRTQAWREGAKFLASQGCTTGGILFGEPEKEDLPDWAERILESIVSGEADFVNANRTLSSHQTYPEFQFHTETVANALLNMLLAKHLGGVRLDGFYGARAVSMEYVHYFASLGSVARRIAGTWGVTHLPMIKMVVDGLRVRTVDVDITYPQDQRRAEEGDLKMAIKRVGQLVSISETTMLYLEELGVIDRDVLAFARKSGFFGLSGIQNR